MKTLAEYVELAARCAGGERAMVARFAERVKNGSAAIVAVDSDGHPLGLIQVTKLGTIEGAMVLAGEGTWRHVHFVKSKGKEVIVHYVGGGFRVFGRREKVLYR